MKNIIIIPVLILACLASGCETAGCKLKDKKLTGQTTTGANTMSCKIDGDVWVANGISSNDNIPDNCKFYVDMNSGPNNTPILQIIARTNHRCASKNGLIAIVFDTARYVYLGNGVKRFELIKDTTTKQNNSALYSIYIDPSSFINFPANPPNPQGWVELTRNDAAAGIVSGRFEFYGENKDGIGVAKGTKVHISEGRFDINYKNLPDCRTSWL